MSEDFHRVKIFWGLKDITFLQTRYNFNFNVKYRISQVFNVRLSLSYGLLMLLTIRGSNEEQGL